MTFNLGGRLLGQLPLPLHQQAGSEGTTVASGSLTGPEGRPLRLESRLWVGQRGVGTASRRAEMQQSSWDLVCFLDGVL